MLGACFFGETFIFGLVYSLGLFYTLFNAAFPDGGITVAWAVTLNTFCIFMASPLGSFFNDRFGTSWTMIIGCVLSTIGLLTTSLLANSALSLCVTHGVITSWGWGVGFSVTLKTLIGVHFSRFRKLAFCVSGCGCGLGGFVFPPVVEVLDQRFGWRGVMLLIAGANLNLLAVAAVARSPRGENVEPRVEEVSMKKPLPISDQDSLNESSVAVQEKPLMNQSSISLHDAEEAIDKSLKPAQKNQSLCHEYCSLLLSLLKDYRFVLFSANVFLVSITASLVNTHLPGFALSQSLTGTLGATFLLSILGIASMIGRLICGFIALRWSVVHIYFLTTLGLGILTIPASLFHSYEVLATFSFAFGLLYSFSVLLPELVIILRGLDQLNTCYALVDIMRGSGMLLGGPLGEALVMKTGGFAVAFVTAGLMGLLGSLGMIASLWHKPKPVEIEA